MRALPNQRTIGLNQQQFTTLLTALQTHLTWEKSARKPYKLTLSQALTATLLHFRQNHTQEDLADRFSVSYTTISRAMSRVKKAQLKTLESAVRPLEQALKVPGSLVVDEILVPTWNWRSLGKTNFSGKHKRDRFNHQVICTLDGTLLAITDPLTGLGMMLMLSKLTSWRSI